MGYGAIGEWVARIQEAKKHKQKKKKGLFTPPTAAELMNDLEYRE